MSDGRIRVTGHPKGPAGVRSYNAELQWKIKRLESENEHLKDELRKLQDYMSTLTEANEVMGRLERNVLRDNTIVRRDNTTKENA